jgi:hypothetical protein
MEAKGKKPDYIDLDNDGNRKESMKQAAKDAEERNVKEAKLDPVGKEDDDINNDGKKDKTDDYLKNRRAKIAQNIKEAEELVQMMKIAGINTTKIEESIRIMEADADKDECNECGMTLESCECDHEKVEEAKIAVDDAGANPVNKPKPEYKSMHQSTMNPGEGDSGEKRMYPPHPLGDNGMAEPSRKMPIKNGAVKESFLKLEAELAAEYESIKKAK